ncbi:hypothetical protein [Cellulomonas sp. URHE0023]|uniref:hypothetical protein n=1 Tax=Cellulomonas sp. URHE0023 TaxID=1380354 RepID=UPI000489434A|nr:hypothetical protein [Cellulomonas sp. URHE0023]
MSALRIGSDAATKDPKGERQPTDTTSALDSVVKWIPSEALTFYAAILGIGAAQSPLKDDSTPKEILERINAGSAAWFYGGLVVAVALVLTGALTAATRAKKDHEHTASRRAITVRIVLAVLAFTLWSTALPGAWPYSWNAVRDVGAAYPLLLVLVGLAFGAIAEWLTTRTKI